MKNAQWNILPECEPGLTDSLHNSLKINKILCRILATRGITTFDEARNFFRPDLNDLHDPFLMKDMHKAVQRIEKAIDGGEKILVFGDYDVDGTTAVALMYSYLKNIIEEDKLDFYIPNRYREGYGVSKAGIDFASENKHTLIISLDCGIKSVELVDYAKSKGIDFIICDHHLPGTELPRAEAILNAKQQVCSYPFKELCGCGVGFKLASALSYHYGLPAETHLQYLDLVATAIAADIVPMNGENRILAYYGLQKINSEPRNGIKALKNLAQVSGNMNISKVVFIIAPRVNAAGRMDDATKAVKLFIANDEAQALHYAEQLHSDNKDRKEADKSITEEALAILQNDPHVESKKTNVVFSENWNKGVVGIVASRVIETFYKPTIILTQNNGLISGSARSIPGFNLYEAIYECRDLLTAYGGHFAAAGVSLRPENLEAFKERFESIVHNTIDPLLLIPQRTIDAEISLKDLTPNFYKILCQMEPFGPENLRPVFVARNVADTGFSKIVKENHLRLVVKQSDISFNGIGFNMADKIDIVSSGKPFDIVFTLDENEWQGNKSLQLVVEDIRVTK